MIVGTWRCIVAPKGIPEDRLQFLEKSVLAALKDPDFLARANKAGFVVQPADAKTLYSGGRRTTPSSTRSCSTPVS